MTILSCSWSRKIDTLLNKNIRDSVSVKTETLDEYKSIDLTKTQDSLSKTLSNKIK
jgi:hypothetical protein